jgi:hypothetical protein
MRLKKNTQKLKTRTRYHVQDKCEKISLLC